MFLKENQKRIIGYRYQMTGVFGYKFLCSGDYICSVSSGVVPSPPVMISGYGLTWRSCFDSQSTIFPELTRTVEEAYTRFQTSKIVYKSKGRYEINDYVSVNCSADQYTFYCDNKVIATIKKIDDKSEYDQIPSDFCDYEPYFDVVSCSDINKELLFIILAFPMLVFGL